MATSRFRRRETDREGSMILTFGDRFCEIRIAPDILYDSMYSKDILTRMLRESFRRMVHDINSNDRIMHYIKRFQARCGYGNIDVPEFYMVDAAKELLEALNDGNT